MGNSGSSKEAALSPGALRDSEFEALKELWERVTGKKAPKGAMTAEQMAVGGARRSS